MSANTNTPTSAVILTPQQFEAMMLKFDQLETRIKQLEGERKPAVEAILSVEEVAKRIGNKCPMTVYRAIKAGKIKTVLSDGKSYGIRESEVTKYLNRK